MLGKQVKDETFLLCDYYGEKLLLHLVDSLIEEESQSTRKFLMTLVKQFGHKALPEVIKRVRDERWYVRRNMICILAELGESDAISHLRPFCRDNNPKVSFEAIKCLLKAGDNYGIIGLKRYLGADSYDTVEKGINLASLYKVKEAAPDLIQLLKRTNAVSADFYQKIPLVKALGQIGDPSALDALRELLSARSLLFKSAVDSLKEEIYKTLKYYPYEKIKDLLEAGIKSKNDVIRGVSVKLQR